MDSVACRLIEVKNLNDKKKKRYPTDRLKLHADMCSELGCLLIEGSMRSSIPDEAHAAQADHTAIHATADMYNVTPEQLAEIMKSIFGEKPLPELPKDLTVASGEPDIPHGEEDES